MKHDFIIVGQGLAGSVLALCLMEHGYRVMVIDEPGASACSRVAAGIWNPVVFKRLTKSWLADEVVPELAAFYETASVTLGLPLIRRRAILKPFTEEQERLLWIKKALHDNAFLDPDISEGLPLSANDYLLPYGRVLQAGNLDVAAFLDKTRDHLGKLESYLAAPFDHQNLTIDDEAVRYKHLEADHIIFCEGHLVKHNPFFSFIPLKPAKGEVLTIFCPELLLTNDILNKGIFIMPLGDGLYKVGATYNWEDQSDTPTNAAREWLNEKLNGLLSVPFTVLAHEAGVRPSVIDRRPVVGSHPLYNRCHIFNGFGTKAVMLAPFFARQLASFFRNGTDLHPEVNPARFYQKPI